MSTAKMNDITTNSVLTSIDVIPSDSVNKTPLPQVNSEKLINNYQEDTDGIETFNTDIFKPTSDVAEALKTLLSSGETDPLTMQYVASVVHMYMEILVVARREYSRLPGTGDFPFPAEFRDILFEHIPQADKTKLTEALNEGDDEVVWNYASDYLEPYYGLYGGKASSLTAEKCYKATLEADEFKLLLSDVMLSALTILCLTHMDKSYTKVALHIADVYSKIVDDLNVNFFNQFSTWISSDDKGVKIAVKEMLEKLKKYEHYPFTSNDQATLLDEAKLLDDSVSEATGKTWIQQLGLSDGCLVSLANKFWLVADLSCMTQLRSHLIEIATPSSGKTEDEHVFKTTAEYDAFQKEITNNSNQLSTLVSTVSSNASHTVDQMTSLYKVLHNMPDTLFNINRDFLRN
nr:hypothetical protein [Escherichia coli]